MIFAALRALARAPLRGRYRIEMLVAAAHESGCGTGTFETCRPALRVSVPGGDRSSSAHGQTDANDPLRTFRTTAKIAF
jgi:hypothetical protein